MVPDFRIKNCVVMFFCPYEGFICTFYSLLNCVFKDLEDTLGEGPCNDATTLAGIYIEKGYKIFYFCDATPLEYISCLIFLLCFKYIFI
jgi:hypothetical protein